MTMRYDVLEPKWWPRALEVKGTDTPVDICWLSRNSTIPLTDLLGFPR
jgi:hypothetical protein